MCYSILVDPTPFSEKPPKLSPKTRTLHTVYGATPSSDPNPSELKNILEFWSPKIRKLNTAVRHNTFSGSKFFACEENSAVLISKTTCAMQCCTTQVFLRLKSSPVDKQPGVLISKTAFWNSSENTYAAYCCTTQYLSRIQILPSWRTSWRPSRAWPPCSPSWGQAWGSSTAQRSQRPTAGPPGETCFSPYDYCSVLPAARGSWPAMSSLRRGVIKVGGSHCGLWTLSCGFAHTMNETLKMAYTTAHLNAYWWWQCSE